MGADSAPADTGGWLITAGKFNTDHALFAHWEGGARQDVVSSILPRMIHLYVHAYR